jgi:hypothetical protein
VLLPCVATSISLSRQELPTCVAACITTLYSDADHPPYISILYPDTGRFCGRVYFHPLSRCCTPVGTSIYQSSLLAAHLCRHLYFHLLSRCCTLHLYRGQYFKPLSRHCAPLWPTVFHPLPRYCSPLWPPLIPPSTLYTLPRLYAHLTIQVLPACMPT